MKEMLKKVGILLKMQFFQMFFLYNESMLNKKEKVYVMIKIVKVDFIVCFDCCCFVFNYYYFENIWDYKLVNDKKSRKYKCCNFYF